MRREPNTIVYVLEKLREQRESIIFYEAGELLQRDWERDREKKSEIPRQKYYLS